MSRFRDLFEGAAPPEEVFASPESAEITPPAPPETIIKEEVFGEAAPAPEDVTEPEEAPEPKTFGM